MKKYIGWIYVEKHVGLQDYFTVTHPHPDKVGEYTTKAVGYGAEGAQKAVDYFEIEQDHGPVKLDPTPIGLRVYVEVPE